MALILTLETATTNCSVGISKDGVCIALKEDNSKTYSHAEQLHVFIETLLQEQNITCSDLDAIAVSKGPGSYTGLRIGVSAAKGLAYANNLPLIALDTLKTLAAQHKITKGLLVPMIDARRLEVYCAVFSSNLTCLEKVVAKIINEHSFLEDLEKNELYFLGDGAHKCKDLIQHKNAHFIDNLYPSSKEMAVFAEEKFRAQDFEDVAYFEPFYLKDFVVTPQKKKI